MKNSNESVSRMRSLLWLALAHYWNVLAAQCLLISEACHQLSLEESLKMSSERKGTSQNSGVNGRLVQATGPTIAIKSKKYDRRNERNH